MGNRRVLKYLKQKGFNNIELTLYIMKANTTWLEVLELEQYFIINLMPNLNMHLIVGGRR
jgi:hypothetical protein